MRQWQWLFRGRGRTPAPAPGASVGAAGRRGGYGKGAGLGWAEPQDPRVAVRPGVWRRGEFGNQNPRLVCCVQF